MEFGTFLLILPTKKLWLGLGLWLLGLGLLGLGLTLIALTLIALKKMVG